MNNHYVYSVDFNDLEKLCSDFNGKMNNTTFKLAPNQLFSTLKGIENIFASLGKTLSDDQINTIASNREISKFLAYHGRGLSRSQISGLLKSELGKKFLKDHMPLSRNLLDYSEFTLKDFDEIGLRLEDIRLNTSTVSQQNKLLLLAKQGFSSVDDPVALVQLMGFNFWSDVNLLKNLSLWELLNPLILALDVEFTADCALIYHISGMKHKLHPNVLLNVATKFLVKWLISQDWYAFQYHVVRVKGIANFGLSYLGNLDKIYAKYVIEGENPARLNVIEYMQGINEARGSNDVEAVCNMAQLSIFIDMIPLTPFREAINTSESPLATVLGSSFQAGEKHSKLLLDFVSKYIQKHFSGVESLIWQARLEILSQFAADEGESGRYYYANENRTFTRHRLNVLSKLDALIYKWALELEGVDVESIFRDTSNVDGPLDIDFKTRVGVVPPVVERRMTEAKSTAEAVAVATVETAVHTKVAISGKNKKIKKKK